MTQSINVINLENAQKVPFKLDGKIMFSDTDNELIHLTLKPGEVLDIHTNPFDVIFFVLEGTGIITVEDEQKELSLNSCFKVKTDVMRGWRNESDSILRILVVKQL